MGRHNIGSYVIPRKATDGTTPKMEVRGRFLLEANTTYYFPIGGQDCTVISAHVTWTADPIILTSVKIEDCNRPNGSGVEGAATHAAGESEDWDERVGMWIDEDPTTAFVGVVGVNVTATNGVVTATGDAAGGGCMFHVADTGARRSRVAVKVGATGGYLAVYGWGKE